MGSSERDTRAIEDCIAAFQAERPGALQCLFDAAYEDLLRQARRLRPDARDVSETASLVDEFVLGVLDRQLGVPEEGAKRPTKLSFDGVGHFLAFTSLSIRNKLVSRIRHRKTLKRGGDRVVSLHNVELPPALQAPDLLDLADAMEQLRSLDERTWRVAENKLHAGLSNAEIAASLGVSKKTVEADWTFAKAWLQERLK